MRLFACDASPVSSIMHAGDWRTMKLRLARALLVLTVFTLLAVLQTSVKYVSDAGAPPPPPSPRPHLENPANETFPKVLAPSTLSARLRLKLLLYNEIRLYVTWAIVTPGILYLARRFSLFGRRRLRAIALHAVVLIVFSIPFFILRLVVGIAFGLAFPAWGVLVKVPWGLILLLQAGTAAPIYWLLVAFGSALAFLREHHARQLAEVELRRSLATAQLDGLKFKLQPHFLFNTLNAIASLAQAGDTEAAERVVERLGTLLRLSMETSGRQLVTLEEELTLIDAYLAIEEIRFGDRLRIVRRIAPETLHALVPNLILQPLVENALVHGLPARLDASLLELAARREGRALHIAVRDDGPGLPAEWNLWRDAGAGLRNVRERIQALFPGTGGIRVENGPTGGAVAVLSVPFADAGTTAIAEEWQTWTA